MLAIDHQARCPYCAELQLTEMEGKEGLNSVMVECRCCNRPFVLTWHIVVHLPQIHTVSDFPPLSYSELREIVDCGEQSDSQIEKRVALCGGDMDKE